MTFIDESTRELARRDLITAIVSSNQRLIKNWPSLEMRSLDSIRELVRNTENTVFSVHEKQLEKYLETILTLLLFINDQVLSEDAKMFRILLNTPAFGDM